VRVVDVASDRTAPFRADIVAWLDRHGVDAVLVRPDRYVFGGGDPAQLLNAWAERLAPPVSTARSPSRAQT
jgi:3-(3-hydroxy-phenyl)propionate hydroxylase